MRRIAYTDSNGVLWIVLPVVGPTETGQSMTPEAAEQRAWERLHELAARDEVDMATPPKWIEESALPPDRTFRNAWKADLSIDMTKARDITKEHLRAERAPLLAELDVQFIRALETAGDTAAILAEKQRLRDVTALADTATTVDDLRSIKASTK